MLLAADFDKYTWEEDSLAFVATCHQSGFSAYLERSRSGKGGHVWIYFERPPAGECLWHNRLLTRAAQ